MIPSDILRLVDDIAERDALELENEQYDDEYEDEWGDDLDGFWDGEDVSD